jgi:S1-C subfamily serine protease
MEKKNILLPSVVRIMSMSIELDWFDPWKAGEEYTSVGTGFFIDDKGHFITCAHVIEEAVSIIFTVPLQGKHKYEAELISICPELDIALLRAKNYINKEYLQLGNSDELDYAQNVFAVGFPIGQDKLKITSGVFSGIQEGMIQTDAPINEGNSGGPLIDEKCRVVGINTSKIEDAEIDNIGYATPIQQFEIIKKLMYDVNNDGKTKIVEKPVFGAIFQDTNAEIFEAYNIEKIVPNIAGVLVIKIFSESTLYNAGVRINDILISFDKHSIDSHGECKVSWTNENTNINDILQRYNVGDEVDIIYYSFLLGKFLKQKIKLQGISEIYKIRVKIPYIDETDYEVFGGLCVINLCTNHLMTVENNNRINLKATNNMLGYSNQENKINDVLLLSHIIQGSYVSKLNILNAGDIIKSVNDIEVSSVEEFRKAVIIPFSGRFLKIITTTNNIAILNLITLKKEEKALSKNSGYKISKLWNQFK